MREVSEAIKTVIGLVLTVMWFISLLPPGLPELVGDLVRFAALEVQEMSSGARPDTQSSMLIDEIQRELIDQKSASSLNPYDPTPRIPSPGDRVSSAYQPAQATPDMWGRLPKTEDKTLGVFPGVRKSDRYTPRQPVPKASANSLGMYSSPRATYGTPGLTTTIGRNY